MNRLLSRENPLFVSARRAARLPRPVTVLILALAFAGAAGLLGLAPFTVAGLLPLDRVAVRGLIVGVATVFTFGALIAILWAWIRWYEKRPFASLGLVAADPALATARGVVTGVGMFSAAMALMVVAGGAQVVPPGGDAGIAVVGGVILMLVVFGVRAVAEETLCRGWVLPVIGVGFQPAFGVITATLIYFILDSDNVGGNAIALVNVILTGVLLSLFALNDGHIYGAIGWNLGWNWAQRNLLYLPREPGLPTPGGAVITFEAIGDATLSGGSAGAEGSLAITTVVALALIMLVTFVSQPTAPQPPAKRRSS